MNMVVTQTLVRNQALAVVVTALQAQLLQSAHRIAVVTSTTKKRALLEITHRKILL